MSILTIEVKDNADLELLIAFARRINSEILEISSIVQDMEKSPVYWLNQLALQGGIKSISNPEKWQKEIREDKPLLNRD